MWSPSGDSGPEFEATDAGGRAVVEDDLLRRQPDAEVRAPPGVGDGHRGVAMQRDDDPPVLDDDPPFPGREPAVGVEEQPGTHRLTGSPLDGVADLDPAGG